MDIQSYDEDRRGSRQGVLAACARVAGVVVRTPLIRLPGTAHPTWIKCESLQLGGAFKLRGAYNRMAQLNVDERSRGVVAFSSGNHAQGVARAAKMLGMPALIVMPADAPAVKMKATRTLGAEIVLYDRHTQSRETIAADLAAERGAVLVPSFDDRDVVEGQGSAGIEIAEQLGHDPALVVTPCGGGGLAAGLALALPGTRIIVAEPEGWDDMGRSLELGRIVEVPPDAPFTSCDALQTRRVADLTFATLAAAGARGVWASEDEIHAAMRYAFALGLVLEPGGAVALAVWLTGEFAETTGDIVIVCSGSNVDPQAYARMLYEGVHEQ